MNKHTSGGFAALVALMIVVMIIVFLMAQQYQKLAERNHEIIPAEEQGQNSGRIEYSTSSGSPIDRADAARDALESRDRQFAP
jgi:hypothetical protein